MSAKSPHEIIALLNAYLDGELSAAQAQKLEQQLARDPQMRRQLEQLRQVSDRIGQIPRSAAPKDLTAGVLQQLEREFLLGRDLARAESAGRNHLRLRRFLAAAAMVALMGAVGIIIYGVLRHPDINPSDSSRMPPKVVLEVTGPAGELAKEDVDQLKDFTPAGDITADRGRIGSVSCGSVHLVVKSADMPAGKNSLEDILADQQIKNVFRDQRDVQKPLYAFVCSLRQFGRIFGDIQGKVADDIDLVVTDPKGAHEVVVTQATLEEACVLAGELNTQRQLAYAMRFNLTAGRRSDVLRGNESEEKMLELFAKGELELPDLKLLGPTGLSNVQPNQPAPAQQPFLANQPAPSIAEAPAEAVGTDSSQVGGAVGSSEPDQLVAVVLVLQPMAQPNIPTLIDEDKSTETPSESAPAKTDTESAIEPAPIKGPDEPNKN